MTDFGVSWTLALQPLVLGKQKLRAITCTLERSDPAARLPVA